jgi:hypothetical protein
MKTIIGVCQPMHFGSMRLTISHRRLDVGSNKQTPTESKFNFGYQLRVQLAFAIKTIFKSQIGTRPRRRKKCRAAIGVVEAFLAEIKSSDEETTRDRSEQQNFMAKWN